MGAGKRELSVDDRRMLNLLRTRGLSIKRLDGAERNALRKCLNRLHHGAGLSLSDIAKLIGNKSSGYTSWLCRSLGVPARPFEESRLKAIMEKRRKYERAPFDGTEEDKAYLLGLRHGDLSVSRPWRNVVRVSTSTTHPAMAELFRGLFSPYGHVYEQARYKKDTRTFEWNLHAILDDTFGFLDSSIEQSWMWVRKRKSRVLSYVAGVIDAEGHIGISRNYRTTSLIISIFNTNRGFLLRLKSGLEDYNYKALGPYLDKRKGSSSGKYRIMRKKDYWRIAFADFTLCQSLLSSLPLRHGEKQARKELALTLHKGCKWEHARPKIEKIRIGILRGRDAYIARAARLVRRKRTRAGNPAHVGRPRS